MGTSFIQSISALCGTELASLASGGKYSVYCNEIFCVEGHKGIAEYSQEKVSFYFSCGKLTVTGSNLQIKRLEKGCCILHGKIVSVVQNEG